MKPLIELKAHGMLSIAALIFFFAGVTIALWYLFSPIIDAIIMALIFSGVFRPIYSFLRLRMKIRPKFSALLTCVPVALMTIVPFFYLASRLSIEIYQVYEEQAEFLDVEMIQSILSENGILLTNINNLLSYIDYKISTEELTTFLLNEGSKASQFFINFIKDWVTNTFSYTLSFVLNFVIMLLSMYGIFLNGRQLKKFLFYVLPLNPYRTKIVFKKFNQMNFVTLVVNGIGGILQGILAGIAFWICDFKSVVFWTFTMVLLAFIPLLGISLVYVPATIFLVFQGDYALAIFLFTFCTLEALIIENWFKPNLIGKKIEVNSIFLLLSMIAGLAQFGALGIFYGPIITILFLSFSEFIKSEFIFISRKADAS